MHEKYWGIRIGTAPKNPPYLMSDHARYTQDRVHVPMLFNTKAQAEAFNNIHDVGGKPVRVTCNFAAK